MKIKFLNKIKVFIVFMLFIGTCLIPVNMVRSSSNPISTVVNIETRNVGTQETEYWALIVGVGVYADDPEQNRPLMLEEVDDFYNVLLQSEVWSEDHIKLIKAEDATVSNIISGFRWLDKMEDENDISVVYLTTHGGPLGFDLPPFDEEDKTDEILSTYWSFAYPTLGIWDDEINILLNRLESKGVCVIVDSCYAGGFNDHWKGLFPLSNKDIKKSSSEWIENFLDDVRGQGRVVLMASCEDELSYSGGFAPYLIDGLRGFADSNLDGVVTAEEVFFYTLPRVYMQNPTMYDGYEDELPLVYLNSYSRGKNKVGNKQNIVETKTLGFTPQLSVFQENSIICGYVKDNITGNPIEGAEINLTYGDFHEEYGYNSTFTDYTGFYSMNVAAGEFRLRVNAEGYCGEFTWHNEIGENETAWFNFSLYPRPPENSIVCGYVMDNHTNEPIQGAQVRLEWGDELHYYENDTTSDTFGFYSMNVAAGSIYFDVRVEGYFPGFVEYYTIGENETAWFNFSLCHLPQENSVICGYINNKTGDSINNTRIAIEWVDVSLGNRYQNQTYTDPNGFYSINVASGELYLDIRKMGYEYYDPYRHDADENSTLWFNVTLEQQTIEVDFLKPLRAFYKNNKRIIPYYKTRIIGSIDIEAYTYEDWYGHSRVNKMEFYIDGKLKAVVDSEPFVWTWNEKQIGKHTIKVVAYDFEGNSDSKEIVVYKFL